MDKRCASDDVMDKRCALDDVTTNKRRVPDGGYGWVAVFACFLATLLLVGSCRSFGIIYVVLLERFDCTTTQAAFVMALSNTIRMGLGPVSSALCERFSCRCVVMVGACLLWISVVLMACATNIYQVYASYSVLGGFGGALIFAPTLVTIGQYFDKRKGLAMALATLGSGFGTLLFAPLFTYLFATYGYFGACLLISAILFHSLISGALMRPVNRTIRTATQNGNDPECKHKKFAGENGVSAEIERSKDETQDVFPSETTALLEEDKSAAQNHHVYLQKLASCFEIFHNWTFVLYCFNIVSMPFCAANVFLVLPSYVEENGQTKEAAASVVAIIGVTSIIGKAASGFVFDVALFRHRRRLLHSINGIMLGLCTAAIGLTRHYWLVSVICGLFGVFEGSFHGQRATVLSEMVEQHFLSMSVGYMIFFQGFGNFIAPLWAGYLRDVSGMYDTVFVSGGLFMAFASALMLLDYAVLRHWACRKGVARSHTS